MVLSRSRAVGWIGVDLDSYELVQLGFPHREALQLFWEFCIFSWLGLKHLVLYWIGHLRIRLYHENPESAVLAYGPGKHDSVTLILLVGRKEKSRLTNYPQAQR